MNRHFLIIDDDPVNNHICSKYIEMVFPGAGIITFTLPEDGLDHIRTAYTHEQANDTILFLDINMPVLSGWDVLDRFIGFPEEVKNKFIIYILSSSVSVEDKKRANDCPLVSGFLEKPLSLECLQRLQKSL